MQRGWRGAVRLVVLVVCCAAGPIFGAQTLPTVQTRPAAPDPTLNRAEALLRVHHWRAAHDLLAPWLKAHPKAPDRDRGIFLLAEVYYQNGNRILAFYYLDEVMDDFPESKLFYPALERQYEIADAYLNGYPVPGPFFGWPPMPGYDEAIEMLYRIQERSPGSPLAERALRRTADYYFATSQFDFAEDAYSAFLRSYPRSPDASYAKLRQAFSSLGQFHGPLYDATPLLDARAQFRELQANYPELAARENIEQWIERIDADLARKAYLTADFYRRTGKLGGAAYMYRFVVQTYPDSPEAQSSRRELARLPRWAQDQPAPPASNPEAAATQPTVPARGTTGRPR